MAKISEKTLEKLLDIELPKDDECNDFEKDLFEDFRYIVHWYNGNTCTSGIKSYDDIESIIKEEIEPYMMEYKVIDTITKKTLNVKITIEIE